MVTINQIPNAIIAAVNSQNRSFFMPPATLFRWANDMPVCAAKANRGKLLTHGHFLWHFRKARQRPIHYIPTRRAARIDDEVGGKDFRIIQARGAQEDHSRHTRIGGIDRTAAGPAEVAAHHVAAVSRFIEPRCLALYNDIVGIHDGV